MIYIVSHFNTMPSSDRWTNRHSLEQYHAWHYSIMMMHDEHDVTNQESDMDWSYQIESENANYTHLRLTLDKVDMKW